MSMNLSLTIDGFRVNVPQTKTKETSHVLGFDVDKMHTDGAFTYPIFISSKDNREEFDKVLSRFRQMTVKSIVETQNIDDNEFLTAYLEIQDALKSTVIRDNEYTSIDIRFGFL